jgi:eukaryotic-like serine/threonine-protein kinase
MKQTIGKYKILRELGRGATSKVYLAADPDRLEPVAIKLVSFDDNDAGKWTHRVAKLLEIEGRVVRILEHPNIVRVYDYAVEADQAYIVMEYIEGRTLEAFTTFGKLLPVHEVVRIIFKCCMALDYAFRQGIIHRDIKPANIMVTDSGEVKLTDFGLALNLKKQGEFDSTFIMGVGSPAYMSPEQIKEYPLDQKTDLYSLGVVFYELLTGRRPFRGANRAQLIYKIINADAPPVSVVNPNLPVAMDKILQHALEKDLYSRYKNGADMAKDLTAVRYQILDDTYVPMDSTRFNVLRKLGFFTDFGDVELWETLRISKWRTIDGDTTLMREGDEGNSFGIIVEGEVEVSLAGKRLSIVGAGEPVGEAGYLNTFAQTRPYTVTTLTCVTYLEVNPAALDLATEECLSHFREALTATLLRRMTAAYEELSFYGPPARTGTRIDLEIAELELVPMDEPGLASSSGRSDRQVLKRPTKS